MLGALLGPEISELIQDKQFAALREVCLDIPAPDLAEMIEELEPADSAVLFRVLPTELAADVFEYLHVETQTVLLHALGDEQVASMLNEMAPDDRTALLAELPAAVTQKLLSQLSPKEAQIARTLLGYAEGSVGRRMTPDYLAVKDNWLVSDVLAHIRQVGDQLEQFDVIYVTDLKGRLTDEVTLREILLADPAARVQDLVDGHVVSLKADEPQQAAVEKLRHYDLAALPVLDSSGRLVGCVTADDVLDIAVEEQTEDVQKMAAVEALDAPYMEERLGKLVRKRISWLILLFFGGMLTATAMAHYAETLEKVVILALFIPLVIATGGNSGSQASSLIIRAIALGELRLHDWHRVLLRELLCSGILGLALGLVGFARVWFGELSGLEDYGGYAMHLSLTVMFSVMGVVLVGSLVGSMLPFLLKLARLDPASGSTPLVSTLVDVTGLIIYFTAAMIILGDVLRPGG